MSMGRIVGSGPACLRGRLPGSGRPFVHAPAARRRGWCRRAAVLLRGGPVLTSEDEMNGIVTMPAGGKIADADDSLSPLRNVNRPPSAVMLWGRLCPDPTFPLTRPAAAVWLFHVEPGMQPLPRPPCRSLPFSAPARLRALLGQHADGPGSAGARHLDSRAWPARAESLGCGGGVGSAPRRRLWARRWAGPNESPGPMRWREDGPLTVLPSRHSRRAVDRLPG
jgi:hypothetical protein